jgi:dehydrogenase/reductase SDR family protein 1
MIAVVTGASRGVGKGIALGLGEIGATVYVTGRTRGALDETAAEVTALGGKGIAVSCDHANDVDVEALFERIAHVDVLVNNAFAIPGGRIRGPFWELPLSQWDEMHRVGLRSHYVCARLVAPRMVAAKRGLIVNVSSFGAKIYAVNVAYGVGKAGVDRMTRDMARELEPHGVTCVSLWPGIVKTERLLDEAERARLGFDLANAETPLFSGRAVAALTGDSNVMAKTGKPLVVAELAREYGFTEPDGSQPASLRR